MWGMWEMWGRGCIPKSFEVIDVFVRTFSFVSGSLSPASTLCPQCVYTSTLRCFGTKTSPLEIVMVFIRWKRRSYTPPGHGGPRIQQSLLPPFFALPSAPSSAPTLHVCAPTSVPSLPLINVRRRRRNTIRPSRPPRPFTPPLPTF